MNRLAAIILGCHVFCAVPAGAGEYASGLTESADSEALVAAGTVRGDVDGDGSITTVDALAILSRVVGRALPEGYTPLPNGDTNCDEALSALDVLITLSGIVGRDVSRFCYGQSIVASVDITPAGPVTLTSLGATQALVALAKDGAGAVIPGHVFVWVSDGEAVATVASDGTVTAVANGSANITATTSDVTSAPATVTVAQAVYTIEVTPSGPVALGSLGATQSLSAVAKDSLDNTMGDVTFSWLSDDSDFVTVASDGTVTAVANGSANITASADGVTSSPVTVTVSQTVSSIDIVVPESQTLTSVGATVVLSATAKDADGSGVGGVTLTWTSDDETAATVAPDGTVTAVGNGTATIVASASGVSSSGIVMTVAQAASTIEVTPTAPVAFSSLGDTLTLTALVKDAGGTEILGVTPAWVSDGDTAVTVSTSGRASAVANGSAGITASTGGATSNAVMVTVAQVAVTVEVTPASPEALAIGETQSLVAVATDARGSAVAGGTFTWASNNAGVATVDTDGTVTGVANGSAGVTATGLGFSSSPVTVTVVEWTTVAAGDHHSCGLRAGGVAYCWGRNDNGQLGDGSTTSTSAPKAVNTGLLFKAITAGYRHTCALTLDGKGACWGYNGQGELGDGSTTQRLTPRLVSTGLAFKEISTSGSFNCAVASDDTGHCWGRNDEGQLGDGTTTFRTSPTLIPAGFTFGTMKTSHLHTCALTLNGVAYCWGENTFGQVGDSTTINRHSPKVVRTAEVFLSLAVGGLHACGINLSGSAYCWGWNQQGQVGINSTTFNIFTPTQVSGDKTFVSITADGPHSCALEADGTAWCWGNNYDGDLGDGTTTNRLLPTLVDTQERFSMLEAGGSSTCGVTPGGIAYCWGRNINGQLGIGSQGNWAFSPARVASPIH